MNKVLAAGQKHCVPVGILVSNLEAANQRIAQGFKFIGISSDEGFLRSAASAAFYIVSEERWKKLDPSQLPEPANRFKETRRQ